MGPGLRARLLRPPQVLPSIPWLLPATLGLLPGVGHLVVGRRREAIAFLLAVPLIAGTAVLLARGIWAGVLIGLASSLHAFSIIDLTPARTHPSLLVRMLWLFAAAAALYMLFYSPLLRAFNHHLPMARHYAERGGWDDGAGAAARLLFSVGLTLAVALAMGIVAWPRWRRR